MDEIGLTLINSYPHPALMMNARGHVVHGNHAFLALSLPEKPLHALLTTLSNSSGTTPIQTVHDTLHWQWVKMNSTDAHIICLAQPLNPILSFSSLHTHIIDLLPNHIFWKDCQSIYQGGNKAFYESLGFTSSDELIGLSDYDLPTTKAQSDAFRADDQAIMRSGKARLDIEEKQTTADGIERTLLTSKVPLFNEHQEVCGILAIYTDISQRKEMEQSLALEKQKAEAASLAKSAFIANMSHDIRTPLSGIIGVSQLLHEAPPKDIPQYATWLLDSGNQLLHLLNDVLDVVSADNVQLQENELVFFNLNQLIEELLQLLNPSLKTKGLSLKLSMENTFPKQIKTDKLKLHRILLNLLGNAIKFTRDGNIELSVTSATLYEKPALCFSITDTGQGIGAEHLDKIFDRFYRVIPSYKGLHHGHGVGLHIVKQYCEALNGRLDVTSEEGLGSTFSVIIPIEVENMPHEESIPLAQSKDLVSGGTLSLLSHSKTQRKVLLVEDNAIALRTVEALAKKQNCGIQSATTGEEAFELATLCDFDLIVTDIGLPGISGIELTQKVREFERLMSMPCTVIVGLTAHGKEEAEDACIRAGMQAVFVKPASEKIIQEALHLITTPQPPKLQVQTPSSSLGADLPNSESCLFEIEHYPLLDDHEGITNLGSKAVLCDLLHLMADKELPSEDANLQACYRQQNWHEIEKLAHKLKSSALYCGTKRLKIACQYLERYQKAGHTDLQEALLLQLLEVMAQTKITISQWLAKQS